jgi:glucosamine-6-phosphate deaminase
MMTVEILPSAAAVARAAAALVASHLEQQPALVLGLPTGRTSIGVYKELRRRHAEDGLDFSRVSTVNLDEFVGLAPNDRRSFRAFMETQFFRHVNIPAGHVNFLDGGAADLAAECARFEQRIADLGGIDLQLLGVGANGHIGFNEPAGQLHARSHPARLTMGTRRANADRFGGRAAAVPPDALSMGMATILGARSIVLMATGREKSRAVASMFTGRVTTSQPVSFLQLHERVTVLLDGPAASRLPRSVQGDRAAHGVMRPA